MNEAESLNKHYELAAWGVLFILLGVIWLVPGLPAGLGWLGIGVILIGLNLARRSHGVPASWLSTTLGVIAFIIGVTRVLLSQLGLHVELPLFPVLLIVIGVVLLIGVIVRQGGSTLP